jgi:hypothetical protein
MVNIQCHIIAWKFKLELEQVMKSQHVLFQTDCCRDYGHGL